MTVKRKMPTKKQILSYWKDKLWDPPSDINICWACGFDTLTYRCHIEPRHERENDNIENLILLCDDCHKLQESICSNVNNRSKFLDDLKDGPLFMHLKFKTLQNKHLLNNQFNCAIKDNAQQS